MPIATISFTLPEERYDHNLAVHGSEWAFTVQETLAHIRNELKHGVLLPEARKALESINDYILTILNDRNLTFE